MPPKPKKESSVLDSTSATLVTDRYLWSEWSDADINSEKWDAGAKKAEKGKSSTPSFFEDSDGQPTLPESLASACTQWKRIPDIYCSGGGSAVFEEQNAQKPLSILQSNNHLLFSPFIRSLIGSIRSLQDFCLETEGLEDWRPWSLIFSMNKTGGKEHKPLVNPNGKYVVKLYWIGKWRKVVVDDSIPCDINGAPLLITSSNSNEIWPLVLSKALLKLSAMALSKRNREIAEFNVVTALTGWIHEVLSGSCNSTWDLLKQNMPMFAPENIQPLAADDAKKGDKKDKKKKDEVSASKMTAFCLAELEHAEADLHPCQVIKIRDRPLRPPSPPPVIPRWKLIRPRPDVLQQLSDMERSKIPDRWCFIRSALKVSSSDEDEDHKSSSAIECDKNIKSSNECDWMRIEDIVQLESSRIHLFHRTNNPCQKVIQQNHITTSDSLIANNLHSQFFFADMKDDNQDIIVSFQVQNRKNDWSDLQGSKGAKTPDVQESQITELSSSMECSDGSSEYSPMQILDTDLASMTSSVLKIQNYSLKKYFQTTNDVIKNESYSQGSVRFRLPAGRTVLRFQVSATYASTMTVAFNIENQENIHFGPLDQIMPYGARFPFSWTEYGKALLDAVSDSIQCLGNREELQTSIRKLATLTENNKDHWVAFRNAFYQLAANVLGDTAVPEDLGALRLAFRDSAPSIGPQPYFPNVKNGITTPAIDIAELENLDETNETVSASTITAVSLIARNWRGVAARRNFDTLTGSSAGAIRRQQSAKTQFDALYAKFDATTSEKLIRLFIEESNWPEVEIKALSNDAEKTYSLSTIDGKVSSISEGWSLLFRERLYVRHQTELFPLFTEFGLDKNVRTRIRLLDDKGNAIGQILRRVAPSMVKPGRYTLIGEAEGPDNLDSSLGNWKMQLVSSPIVTNLINPKESAFTIRTERGPYLPPSPSSFEPGLLFRYMIGVSASVSVTFHLSVNNPNAELKLILNDGPNEMYTCGGEKSILIPSCNLKPASNSSNSSSVSSIQHAASVAPISRSNSRVGRSKKATNSNASIDSLVDVMQYTLEGHCVGNWNLSPAEETMVRKLRIIAENEIRVFDNLGSSSAHSDVGSAGGKTRGRSMSKAPGSPENAEQATWTLRIFLDSELAEVIELKSDTRRKEKIRAMKLAWEAAEEGRHKKGYEARSAYLQSVQDGECHDINTLLAQTQKGSLDEDPEVAIAKFRETRIAAEKYCQTEEQERQEYIERAAKQYEELAERELAVFQQIQYSMNATATPTV